MARIAFALTLVALVARIPGPTAGIELVARTIEEKLVSAESTITTTESAASSLRFRSGIFETRAKPSPSVSPTQATTISEIITDAAAEFGLEGSYLISVAHCESTLNPAAYNAAGYHGLFQFDQTTWSAYGYGSIYDPVAQARTAARLLAAGEASRWPNCA